MDIEVCEKRADLYDTSFKLWLWFWIWHLLFYDNCLNVLCVLNFLNCKPWLRVNILRILLSLSILLRNIDFDHSFRFDLILIVRQMVLCTTRLLLIIIKKFCYSNSWNKGDSIERLATDTWYIAITSIYRGSDNKSLTCRGKLRFVEVSLFWIWVTEVKEIQLNMWQIIRVIEVRVNEVWLYLIYKLLYTVFPRYRRTIHWRFSNEKHIQKNSLL